MYHPVAKVGAADLCDGFLVVLLDDSDGDFYEEFREGTKGKGDNESILKHVDEYEYHDDIGSDILSEFQTLISQGVWHDDLPGLPAMAETAHAGCHLCQFLRQTLLQKKTSPFKALSR